MFSLSQKTMASWEPYVHYPGVFTAEDCAAIVARHDALGLGPAKVGNETVDPKIRRSQTAWMPWSHDDDWVFQKLAAVCNDARDNWYPFTLTGFSEPLQLTRYHASDEGHYSMHRDMGAGSMSTRKLSSVVMLSDPKDYDGGDLRVLGIEAEDQSIRQKEQGTVIVFPAWEMHLVSPVTRGTRWSLVAWAHGPRFA